MKKRKITAMTYIVLGFTLLLPFGCSKISIEDNLVKKEINNETDLPDGFVSEKSSGRGLCTCEGFTLAQDEGGDWSCNGGSGCSKVQKCPCGYAARGNYNPGIGAQLVVKNTIEKFEQGRTNGILLKAYFTSQKWRQLFPQLKEKPEVLDGLKNGGLKVIKKETANSRMYMVVGQSVQEQNVTALDIVHVMEIPSEYLN